MPENKLNDELRRIAEKLASGQNLNIVESQIAANVIHNWIKFKESAGRPKIFESDTDRYAYHNAKRRGKPLPPKPATTKKGDQ